MERIHKELLETSRRAGMAEAATGVLHMNRLAEGIAGEQQEVQRELASLRVNIDHIKETVAMQQNYARVAGVVETVPVRELVEDALKMHSGAYLRHAVRLEREYGDVPPITTALDCTAALWRPKNWAVR